MWVRSRMAFTAPRTACSVAAQGDITDSPMPTMRSTLATIPYMRSTTAMSRGASSLMLLIVSLNRSRVASRLPVELFKSTSVSLKPSKMVSTCSTVTSAFSAACASFLIRAGPVRVGLPPLSAMTAIMTVPMEPAGHSGRLNLM